MNIKWAEKTTRELSRPHESDLSSLYHENSKLFPALAPELISKLATTPFEVSISTRSFKQFKNNGSVALPDIQSSEVPLQKLLIQRRSKRDLSLPIDINLLSTLLGQSLGITEIFENKELGTTQYLRAYPSAGGLYPLDVYLIASKVNGLPSGTYHYNVISHELENILCRDVKEILQDGFFNQDFITSCSLVILFVASFARTKSKYGDRGYRLVLLDIGHAAQNVLLSAEQLKIKAVPIAGFCDDSLSKDVSIDGVHEAVIHCICLGK